MAAHCGLHMVVCTICAARDGAQECSKSLEPIEMCSYAFVIHLVGGSPRPVAN